MNFLLFAGNNYYPAGGMNDYVGAYESLLDALRKAASMRADWYQIVDRESMQVVERCDVE